jgi:hypothetical protein
MQSVFLTICGIDIVTGMIGENNIHRFPMVGSGENLVGLHQVWPVYDFFYLGVRELADPTR